MIAASGTDKWYALQVRARWESSTAILLSGKGYKTFLPMFSTKKPSTGKRRDLTAPLFPGYVFCQFDVSNRLPILVTQGVLAVIGRGRIPVPVEDSELAALQRMVHSGVRAEPCPYLEVGQQVQIDDGALGGIQGILVSFKGSSRIVVSVSLLRRSVALEIDRSSVRPVRSIDANGFGLRTAPALLEAALA
jgi:transcription antitermination factor NusG